jgi:NADH-quinone oxidoreductase subunit H
MPLFIFFLFFITKALLAFNILVFFEISFLKGLPIFIPLLVSIAFFTVLERKILAAIQRRRGPNVVGIYGALQAFADGFKLLSKETLIPLLANKVIFILAPIITFLLALLNWSSLPVDLSIVISDISLGVLFIFAISSLGVYGIVMSGWASNSKYAFLGGLRSAAQLISYEVSMGLIIMPILLICGTANLTSIVIMQSSIYFFFPLLPSLFLFFISILAETNRVPFDLPEAESELVSGYNVEYSAVGFVLFFLAEYSNILLMSSLLVCLFLGGWLPLFDFWFFFWIPGWFWFYFKLFFIIFSFIWARGTLPRYRYDQLMSLGWKVIMPLSVALLFYTGALIYIFGGF